MGYLSVAGETVYEKIIEKSRFLAYAAHVEGEEEARAFLERVRLAHPFSTHVCYGYVADGVGNLVRFSDDNEPQGTAGLPILESVRRKKLFETAVAVVRYFGGIKLGAGGLTRAYSSAASEALERAEWAEWTKCAHISVSVDYSLVNALLRFAEGKRVLSKEFEENARFLFCVRQDEKERFLQEIQEISLGKAVCEVLCEAYDCFPVARS